MVKKPVGRPPKANSVGGNSYLPVEFYTISIPLEYVENSKKIPNGREVRGPFTQEEKEQLVKHLSMEMKIDDIQVKQLPIDLPHKCPSCKRFGTPSIVNQKEKFRLHRNFGEKPQKPDYKKLVYNHGTSPKMCNVGRFEIKDEILSKDKKTKSMTHQIVISLKDTLKIDALGHNNRVGEYPLPKPVSD